MLIIVDAYNVLKQNSSDFISQEQRDAFVNTLSRYAKTKNNELVIVFDGSMSNYPEKFFIKGCTVIYSGRVDTADDIIKKYIDTCHPDNTLLVSLDHALYARAHKRSVPSMAPFDFMNHVRNTEKRAGLPHAESASSAQKRRGHVSSAEVDALLSGVNVSIARAHKEEDVPTERADRPQSKSPSKQEKILHKVIKKL